MLERIVPSNGEPPLHPSGRSAQNELTAVGDRRKSVHDLLNTANIAIPVQGAFRSLDTETAQRLVYRQTLCLPCRVNAPTRGIYAHQGDHDCQRCSSTAANGFLKTGCVTNHAMHAKHDGMRSAYLRVTMSQREYRLSTPASAPRKYSNHLGMALVRSIFWMLPPGGRSE